MPLPIPANSSSLAAKPAPKFFQPVKYAPIKAKTRFNSPMASAKVDPYQRSFDINKIGVGDSFSHEQLHQSMAGFKNNYHATLASNISSQDMAKFENLIRSEIGRPDSAGLTSRAKGRIMSQAAKSVGAGQLSREDQKDLRKILDAMSGQKSSGADILAELREKNKAVSPKMPSSSLSVADQPFKPITVPASDLTKASAAGIQNNQNIAVNSRLADNQDNLVKAGDEEKSISRPRTIIDILRQRFKQARTGSDLLSVNFKRESHEKIEEESDKVKPDISLQFFGACRAVTGSQHLLRFGHKKILLDCGFYQGRRAEMEEINRNFPFAPRDIDVMILSHAHIDHCGNIPNLTKQGFKGKIYCTPATKSLTEIMLADSARIQEHDIKYLNKTVGPGLEPIYTIDDIPAAVKNLTGREYGQWFEIFPGLKCLFQDAGHVLGSALITLEMDGKNPSRRVRLGFTGDLGRKFLPILRDPEQIKEVDYLISESTYGDRSHDDFNTSYFDLAKAINQTYQKGGKVIIPSFALERAQELIYIIHELINAKAIPDNFVYVDSPLTVKITEVFADYPNLVDEETKEAFLAKNKDPFIFTKLRMVESVEDSKKLNALKESGIIISASGMGEFGRIRHHLKNTLGDHRNTVIIVGFMAENTLGRRLLEGAKKVNILGQSVEVKADIVVLNSLSAHADQRDLVNFIHNACPLKKLFLVHGETKAITGLKEQLTGEKIGEVVAPELGEAFELS